MENESKLTAVSVIVPVFNRNHTLPRALSSALGQTFKDLEIIVVDDASQQPAEAVLETFRDPRVRLIVHEKNRGANAARNTGILNAIGKYVAFLDSDDEWYPNKVAIQVSALDALPLSVGGHWTGLTVIAESGEVIFQKSPRLAGNILPYLLQGNEIGPLSTVMVRRSVLAEVDGFDESLPSSQDWDLYLRIAERYEFASVGDSLVRYHQGAESITQNAQAKALGRRMILEKYESQMARFPRAFSRQLAKAGHYYCRAGELSEGRGLFLRAIRMYPLAISAYLFLAISLFGVGAYQGSVNFRKKLRLVR